MNIDNNFPVDMAYTLMLMNERSAERLEKYETEMVKEWFPLLNHPHYTVLGSFVWSSSNIHHRWMKPTHAYNLGAGWVSPADIARDYLGVKYQGRKKRTTTKQYKAVVEDRRQAPLAAYPGEIEQAVYVDLSSAYWNIVRTVGWDVDYSPGRFMSVKSDVEDFPAQRIKLARNSLVSVGLPGFMKVWTGSKLIFAKKPNTFINLVLWRLVCDVLNGIAYDMLDIGAQYVHTDGYILPVSQMEKAFDILETWGLPGGVKREGKAIIYGVGNYAFPGYQSAKALPRRPRTTVKVYADNISWLRKTFGFWAHKRDIIARHRQIWPNEDWRPLTEIMQSEIVF